MLWVGTTSGLCAKVVYEKPIYNPETRSYFELVSAKDADRVYSARRAREVNWGVAQMLSAKRVYKGVRGRLAVVDSDQTHAFIRTRLQPDEVTWIGLRYWCKTRVLQWSTGQIHPFHGFRAWARDWHRAGTGCADNEYLAVV